MINNFDKPECNPCPPFAGPVEHAADADGSNLPGALPTGAPEALHAPALRSTAAMVALIRLLNHLAAFQPGPQRN